jgi:hypothetical protein
VPRIASEPGRRRFVLDVLPVSVPIDADHVVFEVGLEEVEIAVVVVILDRNSHPGLLVSMLIQRDARHQADLAERPVAIVPKQQARVAVACDIEIDPIVAREAHGHRRQSEAAILAA